MISVKDTSTPTTPDEPASSEAKEAAAKPQATSTPMEESPPALTEKKETSPPVELAGLSAKDRTALLEACVALIEVPVEPDALNAVLRLCLRLTQSFDQAVLFAKLGGVKMLLGLTQASNFTGFASLATLLIRHVMEDPDTLKHTMERVIRMAGVNAHSSNTKEFHYMLRMLSPAACRAPDLFVQLASGMLRVDFALLNKRPTEAEGEDPRLLLKAVPMRNGQQQVGGQAPPALQEVSHSVICDLLNFLILPEAEDSSPASAETSSSVVQNGPLPEQAAANAVSVVSTASNRTQVSIVRNSSSGELTVPPTDNVVPASKAKEAADPKAKSEEDEKRSKKPLLTKSVVCRLLAELVKSYSGCARLITDHIYEAGASEAVKEDTPALAFLLDELLISKSDKDKDLGSLVKTLVAALASCNICEAQLTLVAEVKSALARALSWPESSLKHTKVQALAALVSTMIESCPTPPQGQQGGLPYNKQQQYNMNNIVKLFLKRGIISDLARVPHSLDLSSPNVAATVNAALKPLETLARIVNTPSAVAARSNGKGNKSSQQGPNSANDDVSRREDQNGGADNATGSVAADGCAGTNTTNSEATRAQGDETVEPDAEATEHDVSTAAESMVGDPNSESQLQVSRLLDLENGDIVDVTAPLAPFLSVSATRQTVEEGNDEDFDEMMEQLLDRDGQGQGEQPILAEVIDQSIEHANFDVDDTQHDSQVRHHLIHPELNSCLQFALQVH